MQRTLLPAIWIAALILLTATMLIPACNDDDDDNTPGDDEATPDLNGWTDEDGTLVFQDENNQQCPPPLPDLISESELQTFLDAYLGDYLDEYGNKRELECDPTGRWEVVCEEGENFCRAGWRFPVLANIKDQDLTLTGHVIDSVNPWAAGTGQVYLDYEDRTINGDRFANDFAYRIVYAEPTFGAVWTKEEK